MKIINEYVLLPVLPFFLIVCGLIFIIKFKFYLPSRLAETVRAPFRREKSDGISPFAALTVALAGTLGVGNIAGVGVAISLGGAGAVFWMWISALFCMSIKFAETLLSVHYRQKDGESYVGGAMYYISKGLKSPFLAMLFCVVCIASSLLSGPVVQINSASSSLYGTYGIPTWVSGLVCAVLCGVIVLGGIKSISEFTVKMIPLLTLAFIMISLFAIGSKIEQLPRVISDIFHSALNFKALGSGLAGSSLCMAIKHGVAKGVLSHEAGSGTSAMSHASADTSSPVKQGFFGMLEVFIDTIVMCTLTSFVVLLSNTNGEDSYDGIAVAKEAYANFFPVLSEHIITVAVAFFAFATIICWSYYGTVCVRFLFPKEKKAVKIYIFFYCVSVFVGSLISAEFMWQLTDFFTCVLTFLNTSCLLALASEVSNVTENYFGNKKLDKKRLL